MSLCGWLLYLTWTYIITVVNWVYFWYLLCVSFPCKLSPYCTCVLTIGNLICCLTLHFLGSEIPDRSKRHKLGLKGTGVSHKNEAREEEDFYVPTKDNKSEGGVKGMKGALCSDEKSGVYNGIRRGPSQDVPFFYTQSHLSKIQSCKSIISAAFFHFHI